MTEDANMKRELLYPKGWMLRVKSYEGYGEYRQTCYKVFDTKEEMLAVKHIAENLWTDYESCDVGIGNEQLSSALNNRTISYLNSGIKLHHLYGMNKLKEMHKDIKFYNHTFAMLDAYGDLLGIRANLQQLCRCAEEVESFYIKDDIYIDKLTEEG